MGIYILAFIGYQVCNTFLKTICMKWVLSHKRLSEPRGYIQVNHDIVL